MKIIQIKNKQYDLSTIKGVNDLNDDYDVESIAKTNEKSLLISKLIILIAMMDESK